MTKRMGPIHFTHVWRLLNIVMLVHFWVLRDAAVSSFIFILLLLVMVSLRWRFRLPLWSVFIDIVICLLFVSQVELGVYGFVLPMFELALHGRWIVSFVFFAIVFLFQPHDSFLFWLDLQAILFGVFLSNALNNQARAQQEADEQRQARQDLERMKAELLEANETAARQAELMERYRISRELHDHLGHDLTGAYLALQAYEVAESGEEADQLFADAKERVKQGMKSLRDTVHNITPTASIGVERLEKIVRQFGQLPATFQKAGNMLLVPAHIWGLLEAYLKEALTNVARHSNATEVEVDLQVTESIVRLSVLDNGTTFDAHSISGSGLRSLQMRARSLGGSVSISSSNGFLCVCVLPLSK